MSENTKPEIIRLFPLTVYKTKLGLTEDERKELIKEVYEQEKNSKNLEYKNKTSAWTGDTQGYEFLYTDKKFEKLFKLISMNVKKYTDLLGVNNEEVDFYYQRAWATITRGNENIKPHIHKQSHISFAYYLKKEKDDGNLNFHNNASQNELAPSLFVSRKKHKGMGKITQDNAPMATTHPLTDEIIIFPSKTPHSTSENKANSERMSISADISLVAKNSANVEHLLTPVEKWVKF